MTLSIDYRRPKIRFISQLIPLQSSTRTRVFKIIEHLKRANEIADFFNYGESLDEPQFNILVVQKIADEQIIKLVERLKRLGIIIVYDIVDVDKANEHNIRKIIELADGVIVDCIFIEKYCRNLLLEKQLNLKIIPDSIDLDEPIPLEKNKITKTNDLNIVFFANPSNLDCIEVCKEALLKLSKEKSFTLAYIAGQEKPEYFTDLNAKFIKWNPNTFNETLREFDLAIIPQKYEKGNTKLVQSIINNLPAVSTNIESYREIAEQTNTSGFLCKTSDDWYNALLKMFNPEERYKFLKKTTEWVWSRYNIDELISDYREFFTKLLIEKRGGSYDYDFVKVKIRLAELKDVDEIIKLAEEWHPVHNDTERGIRRATLMETLGKEGHEVFIAEGAGKIIGWFDVRTYKDWFMLRYSIHVEHIFVTATYRNRKVGSMILQKIIEYYEKLGEQSNMNLVFFYSEGIVDAFFEKNGFYVSSQHFYIRKKRLGDKEPLGVD